MTRERREPMENIRDILEKELIYSKARVEVIEDLIEKFATAEPQETREFADFCDETQPTTDNTF